MSAATVPIFDPQGVLRDVPQDQLATAVKSGGMPAVKFQAPDKSVRFVPANRTQDAVKAGGQIMPFEEQEVKHPGFWSTVVDYAAPLIHAAAPIPGALEELAEGKSVKDVAGDFASAVIPALRTAKVAANTPAEDAQRQAEERSLPYRVGAPIAEAFGSNVAGQEQGSREGDTGAVAAHFAAAEAPYMAGLATPAVTPFAEKLASALSETPAAIVTSRAARTAGATALDVAKDIPGVRAATKLKANWDATAPKPQPFEQPAPLPATPPQEVMQATSLRRGPQPVIDPAAGLATIRQPVPIRPVYPGASLPATPAAELLQARSLSEGGHAPAPQPADALGNIPARQDPPAAEPAPAPPEPMSKTPDGNTIPRTLSGESALRQVLTGQDNANLMKIAKSRGINVTKESQLKASIADKLLVDKIVDDFSADELSDVRDSYLENTRMGRHNFGDIGAEANKTLSMQTYFPDVKVPLATTLRTKAAIAKAAQPPTSMAPLGDLAGELRKTAATASTPARPVAPASAVEDLTAILEKSLKQAQQQKAGAQ